MEVVVSHGLLVLGPIPLRSIVAEGEPDAIVSEEICNMMLVARTVVMLPLEKKCGWRSANNFAIPNIAKDL